MKNRLVAFSILYILIAAQTCSNNNHKRAATALSNVHYHKIDFTSFIAKHKNDSLDSYEDLLVNKEFVNVLEHDEFYKNDVNTFLKNGVFTDSQSIVCICAMQNLNVKDYVALCNNVLYLYDNNKLSELRLNDALDPDFLRKHILAYNYGNPCVVSLIKGIENDSKVTDKNLRGWLPDLLSGKSAKELHQFEKENYSD